MQPQGSTSRIVRFGTFELDPQEGRITRSGLRVRLQGQPFQILTILLERAGEVVTREEIRQKLWSDQTYVEFDDALNTAVGKLRAAIGDNAENPRFVETVPRRGYRFIAPVTWPPEIDRRKGPIRTVAAEIPQQIGSKPAELEANSLVPASGLNHSRRWYVVGAIALGILAIAAIYWGFRPRHFQISPRDTVIVADFINTTGEPVFDDALRRALGIGLEQSPSIQIMPDRKTSVIFTQMGHSAEEHMTGRTAIEVCQRAGGKVTVQGSIASLGTVYLIGLAAIRCDNGEPIANDQAQARRKEDVVDTLGQVTAQLRARLGESLPSIQKYNAPLEQATTSSLDALNAYSQALLTWDKKGDHDSLPIFKRAVELDPNFAQAYSGLATIYHNLGQGDLARENATKAYELRSRVTQAERSSIEARYYAYVTGELEKTAEVRTLEVQNHPDSAGAYNHLGNIDGALGRYEEAAQDYRRALVLDPTRAGTHSDLATVLLALNRVDEASTILAGANQRSLHTDLILQANYWIAFLRGDTQEMANILQRSSSKPESQSLLLSEQSNTEAYYGRFHKACELSRRASSLMEQQGDKDAAARYLAQAALRQAEVGDLVGAKEFLSKAQRLSHDQDVIILAALTTARMGELKDAEALSTQLDSQSPVGTYVQKYWLPTIRAEIELSKGRPAKALDELSLLSFPLEFAGPPTLPVATLYPAYVRAESYLAAADGPRATIEFQKLRDHRGSLINYPLASISLAGLARAYALAGDTQKARQNYAELFQLWKDADPDLPVLKDAKVSFSKLK